MRRHLFLTVSLVIVLSIVTAREINVGIYDNPPLCYVKDGDYRGVFPDILRIFARAYNWVIHFERVTFIEGLRKLENAQLDVLCAVAYSPEREKIYDFNAETIVHNWGKIYHHPSEKILSYFDLDGKRLAVVKRDIYYKYLKEELEDFGIKPIFVEVEKDYPTLMKMVENHEVSACVVSMIFGKREAGKYNVKESPIVFGPSELRLALKKGDERVAQFAKALDSWLVREKHRKNSTYHKVIEEYLTFEKPIFPTWLKYVAVFAAFAFAILTSGIYILRRMVKSKVKELQAKTEELEAFYQELQAMNEELEAINIQLNETLEKIKTLIETISEMGSKDIDETTFLRDLLHLGLKMVPEAKYGSISMIDGNKWKFIATVGHDLEKLNNLPLKKEYMIIPEDVTIINNIFEYDKKVMPSELFEKFLEASKPVKTAAFIPLKIGNNVIGNIALDLLEGSKFSEESIEIMKALASLSSAFLAMREFARTQGKFQSALIRTLVKFIEIRDPYTRGHSERVARLSAELAERLGLSHNEIRLIYWAGMVHDVGKILVEEGILNKPGRLTHEEKKIVEQHPVAGAKVLEEVEETRELVEIVLYHHERWDGNGYPRGLKNGEIPLGARILAVVDSYDAMTSDRPYRNAMTPEEALNEIKKNAGKQFDPNIVDVFLEMMNEGRSNNREVEH